MQLTFRIALGMFVLLAFICIVGWVLWRSLKNSFDPARLLFRWIGTLVVVIGGYFFIDWIIGPQGGPMEKIVGLFAAMLLALVLAVFWVPAIVDIVSNWIGSIFTGGSAPPPPQPYYSIAETKRKQYKFKEAIHEVQRQLEKFPTDVTGQMMLASIQAENLDDLPAARITIERLCQQPDHSPPQIANAWNALADWYLKLQDTDAARAALEQIIARFPDTEQAQLAAQRIAHLASKETLLAAHEHKPIHLRHGAEDIGLRKESSSLLAPEQDAAEVAGQLVKHLEQHPLDNEAREKLAMLYAEHYHRLDLAADQLDQLIGDPNQPGREVARWLNVLADLQLKHGADYDTIRGTLQRVVDLFPDLAAAQLAQQRIELLRLELKGKEKSQVVKLGSYEKDLGLKGSRPPNA
jgi:outer membrane protein assembly factor BamD (BamD/ComL family)